MLERFLTISFALSLIAIAVIFASCSFQGNSTAYLRDTDSVAFETANVVRVIDGDTIVFNVNGEERKCRLCGIDAPESVHPDESRNISEGNAASSFLKSIVPEGSTMYLQSDSVSEDKYGRILRYAWFEIPASIADESEIKSKMLNALIVANGYAQAKHYEGETLYANVLHRLQREAASANLGVSYLWR